MGPHDRDRGARRDRALSHRRARRHAAERPDAAREAGRAARAAAGRRGRRSVRGRGPARHPEGPLHLGHVGDGRHSCHRGNPGRTSRGNDDCPRRRSAAHGAGAHSRETSRIGRDARLHVRHLHRQDRNADGKRHARYPHLAGGARTRGDWLGILAGRGFSREGTRLARRERPGTPASARDRRSLQRRPAGVPRRVAHPRLADGRRAARPRRERGRGSGGPLGELRTPRRDRLHVCPQAHGGRRPGRRGRTLDVRQGLTRGPPAALLPGARRGARAAARPG